jgi:hypothetical protein
MSGRDARAPARNQLFQAMVARAPGATSSTVGVFTFAMCW